MKDIVAILKLDELLKCMLAKQLPTFKLCFGLELPKELRGVDAALCSCKEEKTKKGVIK
jgi:hypothetical protein